MNKELEIADILTTFFYDLAKEVPIGTLNRIMLNTLHFEDLFIHCDKELEVWASSFTKQLMDGKSKFTREQEILMLKGMK